VNGTKGKLLLVLVVLGALAAGTLLLLPSRPPKYRGRSLRELLQSIPNDPLQSSRPSEAGNALQNIGSNAIPYLVEMLRTKDPTLIENLKTKLDYYPSFNRLYHHTWQDRIDALKGIAVLGPAAKGAVLEVSNTLEEGFEPNLSITALHRIGPAAVPTLLHALTITNLNIRFRVVPVLTDFHEQAADIVPVLEGFLDDPDSNFCTEIAGLFPSFGPVAKRAMPKLLSVTGPGRQPNEREAAVRALCALDPEGALQIFLDQLEAPNAKARNAAAESLGWLGYNAETAVPALIKHLQDEDITVRLSAALALGRIQQRPELVVPALLKTLLSEDLHLAIFSALALAEFGDQAKAAVPFMKALLERHSTNEYYSAGLRHALSRIDHTTPWDK
jgi:HEAT repeat protein